MAKRFIYTWTGFWSLRKDYLAAEPFAFPHIVVTTTLTVLLLVSAWRAMRFNPDGTLPLLLVLASYPLVYYIAHSGAEYRHPNDPTCVVFIGYLASSTMTRRTNGKPSKLAEGPTLSSPAKDLLTKHLSEFVWQFPVPKISVKDGFLVVRWNVDQTAEAMESAEMSLAEVLHGAVAGTAPGYSRFALSAWVLFREFLYWPAWAVVVCGDARAAINALPSGVPSPVQASQPGPA